MRKLYIILISSILLVTFFGMVIFSNIHIYTSIPFFKIPLSHPDAPINQLFPMHHPMRSIWALTPVAVDNKGRIYIVGGKGKKTSKEVKGIDRVIVIDKEGKIEKSFIIQLKEKDYILEYVKYFAVSPSGNRIWTAAVAVTPDKKMKLLINMHDENGKAKFTWEAITSVWGLFAYEDEAYTMNPYDEVVRYKINQMKPEMFYAPELLFLSFFFKDGKFWFINDLNFLAKQIEKIRHQNQKGWIGITTWIPEENMQLVSKFEFKDKFKHISYAYVTERGNLRPLPCTYIDEQGNLFIEDGDIPPPKIKQPNIIQRLWKAIAKWIKVKHVEEEKIVSRTVSIKRYILKVSMDGKVLERIHVRSAVPPKHGEQLKWWQLVKADKTGIYLEVEKVNEPREYRIVRIVKKRRWQVWLEGLKAWIKKRQ